MKAHRKDQKTAVEAAAQAPAKAQPRHGPAKRLASYWVLVAIVLAGAILRIWGISDRHFTDVDTSSHWDCAAMYRVAWDWYRSGAYHTQGLLAYADAKIGTEWVRIGDTARPLMRILRGGVMLVTGERSIIGYSLLDIFMAVLAFGILLIWSYRTLGSRIAILAGLLWLCAGSQYIVTGRSYDYSVMTLCATVAWWAFMKRNHGNVYRATLIAGLAIGAGILAHYNTIFFVPLCLVFILLYRNPARIPGKLKELVVFAVGIALPILLLLGWYRLLSRLTGETWPTDYAGIMGYGFNDLGAGLTFSQQWHPTHLGDDWFMWRFVDGPIFPWTIVIGVITVAVLHFRRYRWRWSICDDPLFILCGVAVCGELMWGFFFYKSPRARMAEVAVWPILAGIGIHYLTTWISQKALRGRWLSALQVVVVVPIMINQWMHTEPMVHMGAGIRSAMTVISHENRTAWGDGVFAAWPCTMTVRRSSGVPGLSEWEYVDEILATNRFDYFYVDNAKLLSFIVCYPGAGQGLMLDTLNRLLVNHVQPVWRFEYGAPIHAAFEHDRTSWVRQWYTLGTWRQLHPEPTSYDVLVRNVPYFDVYRAEDVIRAFHASRVNLLARLLVLRQRNPQEFANVYPRLKAWIEYNAANEVIMQEARQAAARLQ